MNKFPNIVLIFSVLLMVVSFWFLVHVAAIFGIFFAVAYPFWWLLLPKHTLCLLCRVKADRDQCPFCRRTIQKRISISPQNFTSAVYNGGLILCFSIISIGVVFFESQVFFKSGYLLTPKSASFVIPSSGQHRIGELFPIKIEIAGIQTPINAVQADLIFDSSKVEVVDISTEDSFANIFIQKEINNDKGYARLTGGLSNPGFFGDKGIFGTFFFRGKTPGVVKIEYLPSSMVLANDSRGTNVLKDLASASYLILPEKISNEEEEMQNKINLQSSVLGESTGNTQMKFYQEGSVLGTKEKQKPVVKKKLIPVDSLLDILERLDMSILGQYKKLFGLS